MQHQKKTKKRSKKRKNTNHYQKNNRLTIPIIIKNFNDPVMNILLLIELSFFTLSLEELIINSFHIIFKY